MDDLFADLFPKTASATGSKAVDLISGGGLASIDPTGGWLSLATSLFSGSNKISGATGAAGTTLNTSGQVVGKGSASGGDVNSAIEKAASQPWYVWGAGALLAIAVIKKVSK